jgi:hypothetical protein
MTNWNDPVDRARLIEEIGPAAYEKAHAYHHKTTIIATIGGHSVYPVQSRFGTLFVVGYTGNAFSTLDKAKSFAERYPIT